VALADGLVRCGGSSDRRHPLAIKAKQAAAMSFDRNIQVMAIANAPNLPCLVRTSARAKRSRVRILPGHGRRTRVRRSSLAVVVLLAVALVGCKKKSSVLLADAAPPPSFADKKPADASIEIDEAWKRAMLGDPIDLGSLADREGAMGLLAGVEQGGEIGVASLHALPYADDADLALRRLGEIALQTDGVVQQDVVDVIERIAARPATQTEVVDASGARACADAMLELARKTSLRKETRARAISALRLLAERLVVDPTQIPTDLDEK
jgi:hypothetical protein